MNLTVPRVTIGIPVYNEEEFLTKTIESAINQTYHNMILIIIDNCSTDNSYDIAVDLSKKDARIKVIRSKKNIGLIKNFQAVLKYSSTEYFTWLGAHDIFNINYISSSVEYLDRHKDVVMVYPKNAVFIDKNDKEINIEPACSDIDTRMKNNAIDRFALIVRSLNLCTNIHGVFRAAILKKLPIKKVIGSDHLVLAMAGIYGQIHGIPIEGIRRREFRFQSYQESVKRWKQSGVFDDKGRNPYKKLINLHLYYFLINRRISLKSKILNFFYIKSILNEKFLSLNMH
jgi:glycosyltransferase involved in cell wall biosynthesis